MPQSNLRLLFEAAGIEVLLTFCQGGNNSGIGHNTSMSLGSDRCCALTPLASGRKSVRPKSRTDILRVHSMHKHLIDRHKQWIMKVGTQCV
jgi:hypothetical protein